MKTLKHTQYRSFWYKKIFYYLQAGQSLVDAVFIAGEDVYTKDIYEKLQTGTRLSVVCNEYPYIFSHTELSLIEIGEKTSMLKEIFCTLSTLLNMRFAQKTKLVSLLIYPLLVLLLSGGLLAMILVFIVPKITPLFQGMDTIPGTTSMLIALSEHVIRFWWVDSIIVMFFIAMHIWLRNNITYTTYSNRVKQYILNRTIYVRDVYLYWHLEKWLQIMYICLSTKIPLFESIILSNKSVSSSSVRRSFLALESYVGQGGTCAEGMMLLDARIYKKLKDWQSIIKSGEQTGLLSEVFLVCHAHIQQELNTLLDRVQKFIEPALIVGVGLMVLIICISIIVPMYQLTQSFQ